MKIQTQLNRIERELSKVQYEGIDAREAFQIAMACTAICEIAAKLAGQAREVMGRKDAKKRLVKKVRAALGFVYP